MSTKEIEETNKGIAFSTKRVIMKAGTYPKLWHSKSLSNLSESVS